MVQALRKHAISQIAEAADSLLLKWTADAGRALPVVPVDVAAHLSHTGADGKKWRTFHIRTNCVGGLMGKRGSVMNTVREQSVDTLYLPLHFVRILLTI